MIALKFGAFPDNDLMFTNHGFVIGLVLSNDFFTLFNTLNLNRVHVY